MEQPNTRYARNGKIRIAYQVLGDAPLDVVFVPGFISHLDLWWSLPQTTAFFRRVASFSRLILFDKPGTGLSDPVPAPPTLEERMEDLHAVLDAAGSERTAVFGLSEAGPMSILYTATYPERVTSLTLYGSSPRFSSSDSFLPERRDFFDHVRQETSAIAEHWGEGRSVELFAPNVAADEAIRRAWALFERAAASPAMVEALFEAWWKIDVTRILPVIRVPTLVLHRTGDRVLPLEAGRYLADHISGARLVELQGDDHSPWIGDSEPLLDEVEQFLTGTRIGQRPDRVLATVLFTDIVGSTERAAALGDARWRQVLEAHDASVRRNVQVHGGHVVKGLGDGYLATFDGPARALRCGCALAEEAASDGLKIRVGVHTGECEMIGDDVAGIAVHIAARIVANARPAEVLASSAVRDLVVGSGIEFADRGVHELKGVPGRWALLAVERPGAASQRGPSDAEPDDLAPNLERARPGDRFALRIARSAPAVARLMSRVTMRGSMTQTSGRRTQ